MLFELATDGPGFAVDEESGAPRRVARAAAMARVQAPGYSGGTPSPPCATAMKDLGFDHIYQPPPGSGSRTLLALHGTGGDEHDLLTVARVIDPSAGVLSPRGRVLEGGASRFFRRLAEGVFDENDLRDRTAELALFLTDAADTYGFDLDRVVAVGFSNGANIASSLLLLVPGALAGAILFRGMVPLVPDAVPVARRTACPPVEWTAGPADQRTGDPPARRAPPGRRGRRHTRLAAGWSRADVGRHLERASLAG